MSPGGRGIDLTSPCLGLGFGVQDSADYEQPVVATGGQQEAPLANPTRDLRLGGPAGLLEGPFSLLCSEELRSLDRALMSRVLGSILGKEGGLGVTEVPFPSTQVVCVFKMESTAPRAPASEGEEAESNSVESLGFCNV